MAITKEKYGLLEWQEPGLSVEPQLHWESFDPMAPLKTFTPERPVKPSAKSEYKNKYYALIREGKPHGISYIEVLSFRHATANTHQQQHSRERLEALLRFRQAYAATKTIQPVVVPTQEIMIAFEGWIDQVADGMATLRLVDGEGRRSVAKYAVADLERDNIPAQVGTAFRCQVARHPGGFDVSFLPVPKRAISEVRRRQREAKTIAAYSTLKNDY